MLRWRTAALVAAMCGCAGIGRAAGPGRAFDLATHRMDVDVDGAPTAYGPRGMKTLDTLADAHFKRRFWGPVVGYLKEHGKAVVQGPRDPAPGYYVSQTAFEDESRPERDPRRYVDATRVNYVVLGDEARRRGVQLGDFVVVHSNSTSKTVFGIVGDDGNPSGDEGSLHLLQSLGFPFHDGRRESVERRDIVIRFYPGSNPGHAFFRTQGELDRAAKARGLSAKW